MPGGDVRAILVAVSSADSIAHALAPLRSNPESAAILFDVDGTLAPIVERAEDARVSEATRSLLIELTHRYALVACVSGRRAQEARQMVGIGSIAYIGNHGAELLGPASTQVRILDPALADARAQVERFAGSLPGAQLRRARVRVEEKGPVFALHWRGAADEAAALALVEELAQRADAVGLFVHRGRKVLEVRPPVSFDKGRGVRELIAGTATGGEPGELYAAAMYVGDDRTDLDAFGALRELVDEGRLGQACCVAVASEEAPAELIEQADLVLTSVEEVRELLAGLL